MIGMIRRILGISGKYKGRIYGAFVLSFLKGMLMKVPIIVMYFIAAAFIDGKISKRACVYAAVALVASVGVQALFQYLADRLQSAAGYMIFADMRMKLGEHLRRLPMGFFTEGNIGRISSVLSTDMVFIEENCMMVIADMMSYLFSQAIMIIFMFAFDWRLGLVSLLFTGIIIAIGIPMQKSDLKHSDARQEASEVQTKAVLDFTEGIGIIKTYNLLGERSKELTDSFDTNCRVNLGFEEAHMPWKTSVYIVYGLATAAVLAVSAVMYRNGTLTLNYFIGMLLFLFDMFVPIRTFYDQGTRLTVMNACMDSIDALLQRRSLTTAVLRLLQRMILLR